MSSAQTTLNRREVLAAMGGLVIGVYLPATARAQEKSPVAPFAPNAFVRVSSDSTVTVLSKHTEIGQGPLTGLATLVAEEMDADWAQVRAEHAPSDTALYKNLYTGMQSTGGSSAISNSFEQMRQAGATARAMLVAAAAKRWDVPVSEIAVEKGVIRHARSNRHGRFGEFAADAGKLQPPTSVVLKDPSQFKLIGRDNRVVGKLDSRAKATGTAKFTIDIQTPDMLTVVVARPPLFGAKVRSFDDGAARAIPGVVDVKQISSGVAIYAKGMWPALKGREALKVQWDESAAEKRSSEQLLKEFRDLSRTPGLVAGKHGDAAAALGKAETVLEAEYVVPYLAHGPMEPLDGYMEWDGQRARARFGSQLQTGDHGAIAKMLSITPDKVAIETMLAGGSFGRRAQPNMEFAIELAEAAKAIGPNRPVKVVWTREDDIRGGYYRPAYVHRMRGAVRDGRIVAWSHTIVGQSVFKHSLFEIVIKDGIDSSSVEGASELPYEIPDFQCEVHSPDVGVPVQWWRSVGHSHTGYAVESFVDELLQAAGKDPVQGRLAMMGKSPRAAGVLRAVAQLAHWSGPDPGNGRARGVAVVESFGTYVAQIAEVSMGENGEPRVHKVWCAVDCGIAVNPDVVRAQMEGGMGYGLGHALYAAVTLKEGRPVQSNFDTYRSLRIHEMPEIEVAIVPSNEKPSGVGEPGVPPVAPAVANALARLGKRPRQLPMVSQAV